MEVSVEELNDVQKKIQVKYSKETIDEYFQNAFQKIRNRARIKGFRPGKAPLSMIRVSHGEAASQMVVTRVRDDISKVEFYKDRNIEPFGTPAVYIQDNPNEGAPFEFHLIVDLPPQFELKINEEQEVDCPQHDIKLEEELDRQIQLRARQHSTQSPVEDASVAASAEHVATMSCQFKDKEGKVISEHTEEKPLEASLDSESHLDPWMVEGLVGMKVGESKTLEHTFEDSPIYFDVKLLKLATLNIPSVDDELAKDLGHKDLEELRESMKKRLEQEIERANKELKKDAIRRHLIESNPFSVPPSLVDNIIDHRLLRMGYPEDALQDKEARDRQLQGAQEEARLHFIIAEYAKVNEIAPSPEEVREQAGKVLASNPNLRPENPNALFQNIHWELLSTAVYEKLESVLKLKTTTIASEK